MNKTGIYVTLAAAILLTGCATKNYGREGQLTGFEKSTMTCREIDLETAKVDGFVQHVDEESRFDGRSILSFLGDFGIGNVMEKDAALKSANDRRAALSNLRASKNCGVHTDSAAATQ
ncbi:MULTISPECIES: hypothetical protein [Burkholderia]|jgi:major membrane immunogen (membrane-anchored lipoprotein)|uniref:Lipoprotein n=1 Tax=Burkholderia ambifaria (strain MC40-6) TaxID=398577 RepID=B1YT96_BURA4|nr:MULTISPECIES: hypothetical protein [Burkholderia]ACB64585.1 hypothetical protein BamMC406_2105 [Burkholderia ambifaria MC40-6]QDW50894.1 hypothetical protein FFI87_011285 [Burkholderia sp. KBS0801]